MLKLDGLRCVIIGGGAVAVRRARSLVGAGGKVTVVAPRMDPRLTQMPVDCVRRAYARGDLAGARVVVIATNDAEVNNAAAEEARQVGALVNRADDPEAGNFTVPAQGRRGPVTIAVDTGGISAAAAAAIRDELVEALDADWPRLLTLVEPYRSRIKAGCADARVRRRFLQRLTDSAIMVILKEQGSDAVVAACQRIVDEAERALRR